MPLTRDFRETVMARVKSDPAFRSELIVEATNAFLMDDMETSKALQADIARSTSTAQAVAESVAAGQVEAQDEAQGTSGAPGTPQVPPKY